VRPSTSGAATALAILLAGCAAVTPADRAQRTDPVARLTPAGESPWREDLGDPTLRDLLRRADTGSLDIKLALARLERARADLALAGAAARTQVTLGLAGASGGRTLSSHREAGAPTLEAGYDFDVSGQLARLVEAAGSERQASAADVANARLLVGAETARAYVGLCAARDGLGGAERRRGSADRALALARARAAEGYGTQQDLAAYAATARGAATLVEASHADVEAEAVRLRVLLGNEATPLSCPAGLPTPTAASDSVSADRVDQRADTQAALARLRAADSRRAAAVAATRPQFQISAVLGAPDAAIATMLDARALAWALAGRVGGTILDGGAGRARIDAATADADAADLAYRKTVLEGWSEMRAAVVQTAVAEARRDQAQADMIRAETRLRAMDARHAEGAVDGLGMAEAREQVEQARDALRLAQVVAANARIRRALAGGGR
jgi:outer membrane protein TolC